MDDAGIIGLYFDRDERAVAETDSKYGKYLFAVSNNILSSAADADECVNDTYMKAWNAIPPQRPSVLRAFLAKITRNLSLNRYEENHAGKRGGGETAVLLDELSEILSNPSGSFDDAELMTLRGLIRDFIGHMKPEARQIFLLRYWYCFSVKETAERCGVSESKVKMSLMRSRLSFKETLENGGISL